MRKLICASLMLLATMNEGYADKLVIAARDAAFATVLSGTVDRYKKNNPDTDIEVINLNYQNLYKKIVDNSKQASGSIDVVLMDGIWHAEFVKNGWIRKLAAYESIGDGFVESVMDVGLFNGSMYSVPWVGNVQLFAYRSDLIKESGLSVPKTFSQVEELAQKIGKKNLTGVVFRGAKQNPIVTSFMPILRAYGGVLFDENGKVAINNIATINAINAFKRMKALSAAEVMSYDATELRNALQQGKAMMSIEVWPSWLPDFDNLAVSEVQGKIDVAPMPGELQRGKPLIGVWSFGITANSQNAERAWDFIKFATSAPNEIQEVLNDNKPPVRSATFVNSETVKKNRHLPAQLEALVSGEAPPKIANYGKVEAILGEYLYRAMMNQMPPEEAVQNMEREILLVINP